MIGAVVIDDIVDNVIVIDEAQVESISKALGAEIIDARPYGLAIGDYRTPQGVWTRNDGGEQVALQLIEREERNAIAEQTAMEALAILTGEVDV